MEQNVPITKEGIKILESQPERIFAKTKHPTRQQRRALLQSKGGKWKNTQKIEVAPGKFRYIKHK